LLGRARGVEPEHIWGADEDGSLRVELLHLVGIPDVVGVSVGQQDSAQLHLEAFQNLLDSWKIPGPGIHHQGLARLGTQDIGVLGVNRRNYPQKIHRYRLTDFAGNRFQSIRLLAGGIFQ
jgi:hypothetical protein